jgi:hypothetical protein
MSVPLCLPSLRRAPRRGKIPEVRTAFEKFGVLQTELPGPAYAQALRKERAAYARVAEKAGIKLP